MNILRNIYCWKCINKDNGFAWRKLVNNELEVMVNWNAIWKYDFDYEYKKIIGHHEVCKWFKYMVLFSIYVLYLLTQMSEFLL